MWQVHKGQVIAQTDGDGCHASPFPLLGQFSTMGVKGEWVLHLDELQDVPVLGEHK